MERPVEERDDAPVEELSSEELEQLNDPTGETISWDDLKVELRAAASD